MTVAATVVHKQTNLDREEGIGLEGIQEETESEAHGVFFYAPSRSRAQV